MAILTESWLSPRHDLAPILGPLGFQYNWFRCDRLSKSGGGIAIIVNKQHSTSTVFSESIPTKFWHVIFLSLPRTYAVYRAPGCSSSKNDVLLKAFSDLTSCHLKCIIAGDFNLSHVGDVSSPPCSDTTCAKFRDFFSTHGFIHLFTSLFLLDLTLILICS